MRAMRGMSSTTMSNAPMRAASALLASAETRVDESREVIEAGGCIPARQSLGGGQNRAVDRTGVLHAGDMDRQICRIATRIGADAMAGRTRICRGGRKPGEGLGRGVAFRWIYLPVAVHRRLPADPGVLPPWLSWLHQT